MNTLEKMDDFFAKRVDLYDEHMLTEVEGCKEGYIKMAQVIPENTKQLLDLGCGTGLELDEIFMRFPDMCVAGIDLTKEMLDKLKNKHPHRNLNLICGDYFVTEFGFEVFDCAVSFQTMHHFPTDRKLYLYQKIHQALKRNGVYIECDYMVETKREEEFYFSELDKIRNKLHIPKDIYVHYDTPCAIETQKDLLKKAGFTTVEQIFRIENTTMLFASK